MTPKGWEAYNKRMDPVLVFWLLLQLFFPPLYIYFYIRYGRYWK